MTLCALPLIATLLSGCAAPPPMATGYVEGDHVMIAPVSVAELASLSVTRGQRVQAGAPLAQQESRDARIAVDQATATLAQAESQLENLREGRRPEEIRVIEAALASARAQAIESERTALRLAALESRGAATSAQREDAQTALTMAQAKVAEIEANLAVARLPARKAEIAAAEAAVRAGQAGLEQARWVLEKRSLTAPTDGVISDLLRRPGEISGPAAPILTMLPDQAVKLRLYLPEAQLAQVRTGTRLEVHCDGCGPGLTATVSYVADGPEFTPPVIYSLQNRQKLVYLLEARPDDATALKPGQIVDVSLAEARK